MKVKVVAFGRRMPGWVGEAWSDYARRMPREWNLELVELRPESRDRGKPVAGLLAVEAQRVAAATRGARVIALDEHGQAWTTPELASAMSRWAATGEEVAFVIGSADGLDPALKRAAAAVVALSALTLPHALVRVLLIEQLYRAASILAGHPYHRA
ncbi:MAG: 23S rRNA (pseudouridine(1915)-N(3))-methyltransferase RlmH [Pseudomonadota bacterium]|nr:23S rRNA (pseudouridine(1915)-N(3))-methyltransferase RlmH [Pseudomonadota bacterium]